MAIFRERIPSNKDIFLAFASCTFPIYVWAIANLLREVPALILRLSVWDLVGVIAYTLNFALIESVLVLIMLLLLSVVFPAKFIRDKFVVFSTVIVFITSIWFEFVHIFAPTIWLEGEIKFISSVIILITCIAGIYLAVLRSERVKIIIQSLVERISVLILIYLTVTFLFTLIVITRNLS